MSLVLRGKCLFGLSQYREAAASFKQAKGKLGAVDEQLKPELERQCTVWNNKC